MTPKQVKDRFNKLLFQSFGGDSEWNGHVYQRMVMITLDLATLASQMKVKHQEIKLRTGNDNSDLKSNYTLVEDATRMITKQIIIIDEYSIKLNELERRIEYYQKQQPMVDFKNLKLMHNGQRLKYIKDFITEDNF